MNAEAKKLTDDEIEAIEQLIDHVVCHTHHNEAKLPFSTVRNFILFMLPKLKLPVPDWLDEGIRDAARFNEIEIDESEGADDRDEPNEAG